MSTSSIHNQNPVFLINPTEEMESDHVFTAFCSIAEKKIDEVEKEFSGKLPLDDFQNEMAKKLDDFVVNSMNLHFSTEEERIQKCEKFKTWLDQINHPIRTISSLQEAGNAHLLAKRVKALKSSLDRVKSVNEHALELANTLQVFKA